MGVSQQTATKRLNSMYIFLRNCSAVLEGKGLCTWPLVSLGRGCDSSLLAPKFPESAFESHHAEMKQHSLGLCCWALIPGPVKSGRWKDLWLV